MSFRLVLFDVDGTVLNADGSGRWAMTRAFEEVFGIQDAEACTRTVRFEGMTDPVILAQIAGNAGIPPRDVESRSGPLRQAFLRHLEARLREGARPRVLPGVVELLDRLAGVAMASVALATGNVEPGARLKLGSVGLNGYFETGGFGGDAPDRAGIGRVATGRVEARLGRTIPAAEVVLVGDSAEDVRAAKINGYRSLSVGTGWTPHEALRAEQPDLFVEDLSDYARMMQFIFGTRG